MTMEATVATCLADEIEWCKGMAKHASGGNKKSHIVTLKDMSLPESPAAASRCESLQSSGLCMAPTAPQ